MSRKLERIRAGVSRNSVISYLNTEHGEVNTIWKIDGNHKDPYRLSRITQDKVPWLAYTADGHPVLRNDTSIDHGADIHINMVRAPSGRLHQQIDMDHLPSMNDFQELANGQVSQENQAAIQESNPDQ